MPGEIKLPVIGKTRTLYVGAGVLIVATIVGVAYYRRRSAAAADQSGIDPQTGLPANSPADLEALAAIQSGDTGGAGPLGGYYGDGYGYGFGGIPGIPTTSSNPNSGPGTFTDNAYWLAYAEDNIIGYTPSQIQGALTAYLSGTKLDSAQYTIYQTALAVAGPPPNPPATTPAPPVSGNPPPTGGNPPPTISGTVQGLSVRHATPTTITLAWEAVHGATGYRVSVLDRGTTHIKESEVVKTTSATLSGLAKKARYEMRVQAEPGKSYSTIYGSTT